MSNCARRAAGVAAVLAVSALAGAGAGVSGALWRDATTVSASLPVPAAFFALDGEASASGEALEWTLGRQEAAVLASDGELATAVRFDGYTQGPDGLDAIVEPIEVSGGLIGQAWQAGEDFADVFWVDDASGCTSGLLDDPDAVPAWSRTLEGASTPGEEVSDAPGAAWLCLAARTPPDSPGADPADEPSHTIAVKPRITAGLGCPVPDPD